MGVRARARTRTLLQRCSRLGTVAGVHDKHRPHGHEHHEAHPRDAGDAGDVPTTALLREARGAYALAIRGALDEHGIGDVPPNSAFLLGGLRLGVPYKDLLRQRRRAIERSGVVDALVGVGCVRRVDEEVELTDRGREVSEGCAAAMRELDHRIVAAIGEDGYRTMRQGLVTLIDWKEHEEDRRR